MPDNQTKNNSLGKRLAALALTLVLAGLAIHMWIAGVGDAKTAGFVGMGIVLGLLYTLRGGSLPGWVYRASESHWAGGTGITEDDDPRNLSPKIVLPILAGAIVTAAVLLYWVVRVKH